MPEVAEVAHVCALLRRNIIGFRIRNLKINNDPILFPFLKDNPNAERDVEILKQKLTDQVIRSAGRHGKYFWLRLGYPKSEETSVLLMHFGMTGMVKIKNVKSHLLLMENGGDKKVLGKLKQEAKLKDMKSENSELEDSVSVDKESVSEEEATEKDEEWPPRFVKFEMELEKDATISDFAFVDPRRLGRIRYLEGPKIQTNEALLNELPLSKLGPDYSKPATYIEKEFTTGDPDPHHHGRPRPSLEDFNKLIMSRKKSIKSLLLDQSHFAGIGNYMGDEICFHARIHPNEILSEKIVPSEDGEVDPVIQKLYESIIYVCEEAVRLEGEAAKFPSHWLMLYRWSKRRKGASRPKTADGHTVDFITIGGRTSCFVPELQKPLTVSIKKEIGAATNKKRKSLKS